MEEAGRQGGLGTTIALPLVPPGPGWRSSGQGAEKWSASQPQQDSGWGRDKQSAQLGRAQVGAQVRPRQGSGRAFVEAMPVFSSLYWPQ